MGGVGREGGYKNSYAGIIICRYHAHGRGGGIEGGRREGERTEAGKTRFFVFSVFLPLVQGFPKRVCKFQVFLLGFLRSPNFYGAAFCVFEQSCIFLRNIPPCLLFLVRSNTCFTAHKNSPCIPEYFINIPTHTRTMA